MERRSCGLGCVIAGLGSVLGLCLLPHLISAVYSVSAALFDLQVASKWLWGDWLGTIIDSERLYMLLAEGPLCCAGIAALLIVILGVVVWSGEGSQEEDEFEGEPGAFFDDGEYVTAAEYWDEG